MTPPDDPTVPAVTWRWLGFDELTPVDLYALMKLRQEVFVVEQNCVYLDADGLDPSCIHGMATATDDAALVAHARLVPAGLAYATPSIGRVVTAPRARGWGLGRTLMTKALAESESRFPAKVITIGAQLYLQRFYESFGFAAVGRPYEEDGIMHIEMTRPSGLAVIDRGRRRST